MYTISSDLIQLYYDGVDALMASDMTSQICVVVYPPKREECVNCQTGPFGGQGSNIYRSGGPAPFTFGLCPVCQGQNIKETEFTENIRLRVYFTTSREGFITTRFVGDPVNNERFDGQIMGNMDDMVKVKKANYILINDKQSGNQIVKCELAGEPVAWGFGRDKYFACKIKRN